MENQIISKMIEYLTDVVNVDQNSVELVATINGYSENTMRDILFATTGLRDFDQDDEDFYEEFENGRA